jgi:HK97 family phage portal protein
VTWCALGVTRLAPAGCAQHLESRKFRQAEIARWFSIPPDKLADLERVTFSNIEEFNIGYFTGTLLHWLETWEQKFNYKLIAPAEQNIQFIEHLVEQFLRGDTRRRGEFYTKLSTSL